jgi:hypothetical protein
MDATSLLSPADRCLGKVDHASIVSDPSIVEHVGEALDELEASYRHPGDRVVAREAMIQAFGRRSRPGIPSPFDSFLKVTAERRQNMAAERFMRRSHDRVTV